MKFYFYIILYCSILLIGKCNFLPPINKEDNFESDLKNIQIILNHKNQSIDDQEKQILELAEAQYYNNIDEFAKGYDVLLGIFPDRTKTLYPGQKQANVFDITYNLNRTTGDKKYNLPDGISISNNENCFKSVQTETVSGSESLYDYTYNSFSIGAGVSGYGIGSISTQTNFENIENKVTNSQNRQVYFMSTQQCQLYIASWDEYTTPPLEASFVKALSSLQGLDPNIKSNEKAYKNFISQYGTHTNKQTTFGAKYVSQYEMNEKQYSEYVYWSSKQGLSIQASVNFASMASIDSSFVSKDELAKAQTFKSYTNSENSYSYSIGPQPAPKTTIIEWKKDITSRPAIIKRDLEPIYEMLKRYYQNRSDLTTELSQTIENLRIFITQKYCLSLFSAQKCNKKIGQDTLINVQGRCRFCYESCDVNQNIAGYIYADSAFKENQHLAHIQSHGKKCKNKLSINKNEMFPTVLCCDKETQISEVLFMEGQCRLCESCGQKDTTDNYQQIQGQLKDILPGKNNYKAYGQRCQGDTPTHLIPKGHPVQLCCKSRASNSCAFCQTCGDVWNQAQGQLGIIDPLWKNSDYKFDIRGLQCAGQLSDQVDYDKKQGFYLCCHE